MTGPEEGVGTTAGAGSHATPGDLDGTDINGTDINGADINDSDINDTDLTQDGALR